MRRYITYMDICVRYFNVLKFLLLSYSILLINNAERRACGIYHTYGILPCYLSVIYLLSRVVRCIWSAYLPPLSWQCARLPGFVWSLEYKAWSIEHGILSVCACMMHVWCMYQVWQLWLCTDGWHDEISRHDEIIDMRCDEMMQRGHMDAHHIKAPHIKSNHTNILYIYLYIYLYTYILIY